MTVHITRLRALLQEQNSTPNIAAIETEIDELEKAWEGIKTEIGASRMLHTSLEGSQHYNSGLGKALWILVRYEKGEGLFQGQ